MQPCPAPYNRPLPVQVMKRIKASVSSKQHGFEDLLCPLIAQVRSCLVLTKIAAVLTWSGLHFVVCCSNLLLQHLACDCSTGSLADSSSTTTS